MGSLHSVAACVCVCVDYDTTTNECARTANEEEELQQELSTGTRGSREGKAEAAPGGSPAQSSVRQLTTVGQVDQVVWHCTSLTNAEGLRHDRMDAARG